MIIQNNRRCNGHLAAAGVICLLIGGGLGLHAADSTPNSLRPIPPAEAPRHMTVPEGFTVTLFAGEPEVAQPIGFTTDDRGRLWVGECYSYPNWAAEGHDRLLVFEDENNTGHFSKRTVLSDTLANLTGLEVGFGGVWLCCPPRLIFIPTDGERPTGELQTILDGWSLKGRHNIMSGLVWGPDGWLYGGNGISSPSLVGKPGAANAERVPQTGGIWRYHPTKHIFESVARGMVNPWGLDFDDYGQAFATNCVLGHLWHVIPGARFKRSHGVDDSPYSFELLDACSDHLHWGGGDWTTSRGGQGIHSEAGGGHAHAGAMVYLGDNWPERYRNSIFMCNIHGNRVNNDLLERSGSGYVGRHGKDFLLAGDPWFRGLNLKYGPDGGVFLSDWSDNGECHNALQTDRGSGRLYKIIYEKPNAVPANLDLQKSSDGELVKLQTHPNDWFVRHARRILQERAAARRDMTAVHAALAKMFDEEPSVPRKLRALWALHATDGAPPDFLLNALKHESEYVRGWAIQFLVEDKRPSEAALKEFARLAKDDPSPLVRLNLASALQRIPVERIQPIAAGLVAHGADASDHNLPSIIWYGIEPLVAIDPAAGLQLAAACKIPQLRRFIARRIVLIDDAKGQPAALAALAEAISAETVADRQYQLLVGLHDGLRGRRNVAAPKAWKTGYARLAGSSDRGIRTEADAVALAFGDPTVLSSLKAAVANESLPADERNRAIDLLLEAHAADLAPLLQRQLDDPILRSAALRGLAAYDDRSTPAAILARYPQFSPDERRGAIMVLTSRPAFATSLLNALDRKQIPATDVSFEAARQMQHLRDREINRRIAALWGALRDSPADKKQEIQRYKNLLTSEFLKAADVVAGKALFAANCGKCHTLFGEGAKIGPDLTGANRSSLDYLLQKVVDPNTAVPLDYQMQLITLKDGRLVAGIVRERTPRALVVQTQTEQITVAADDIESQTSSGQSLMPERQLDKLSPEQVRDLFAYLATRK